MYPIGGAFMLALSRRINEEIVICIGEREIRVKVIRIEGKQVKIGIIAARDIPVGRERRVADLAAEAVSSDALA